MCTSGEFHHCDVLLADLRLHVVETGERDAPPVLFLHGWPQSWASFREVMLRAAGEARAIAIDLPGIGRSAPSAGQGAKRTIADTVHALIRELALEGATLVGHDAGGMVAYAYLRRYADVRAVAILDTVIPGVEPWTEVLRNPYLWHFAFHAIPTLPERLVQGHQAAYFDYFFDALTHDPATITAEARAAYATAYRSDAALSAGFDLYRAFGQDAADNAALADGEPTDTPTLYVRGGARDVDVEPYLQGLRDAGVRHLTSAVLPDAGHFVAEEQPDELWALIHAFATQPAAAAPRQGSGCVP